AELARAHDLGADARLVLLGERVVDAAGAARAPEDRGTEACGDHPLVQPMAGVTEGRVERQALAGPEAIQRNREVVNAGPRHVVAPSARLLSAGADHRRCRNSSLPRTTSHDAPRTTQAPRLRRLRGCPRCDTSLARDLGRAGRSRPGEALPRGN